MAKELTMVESSMPTLAAFRTLWRPVPIRYVAEFIGADTDSERAIRWLIALMVLCCDPLAIALTAAASARR
jgi:hypothetical protein